MCELKQSKWDSCAVFPLKCRLKKTEQIETSNATIEVTTGAKPISLTTANVIATSNIDGNDEDSGNKERYTVVQSDGIQTYDDFTNELLNKLYQNPQFKWNCSLILLNFSFN